MPRVSALMPTAAVTSRWYVDQSITSRSYSMVSSACVALDTSMYLHVSTLSDMSSSLRLRRTTLPDRCMP